MSPQNKEEGAGIFDQDISKLPPAWVLFVALIGGSGVFSGAWWLGLDSAPDRWTGSQDKEYRDTHARQHERDKNSLLIAREEADAIILVLQLDAAVNEERLRSFGIQLQAIQTDHESRLSVHEMLQEHTGASWQFKSQGERIHALEGKHKE